MSYRRKARSLYSSTRRTHLPSVNITFRSMWDQGLDEALARVEQLRSEGWNIDYERGALTQSQAETFAAHVEKHGFETTRIPVAKWGEDLFQFVAYKPKDAVAAGEEVAAPQMIRAQPPKKALRVEKEFNPVERFQKMFWKKGEKPEDPAGGTLMSPCRTMAIVPRDADPAHSVTQLATGIVSKANVREPLDYGKLLKAEKTGKNKVKIGDKHFSIDKMKRAIKIIGRSEAYFDTSGAGVLAIKNQRGDIVLIAPIMEPEGPDPTSITIEELNRI